MTISEPIPAGTRIFTLMSLACRAGISIGKCERLIAELEMQPVLKINSTDHYSDSQLQQLIDHLESKEAK